MKCIYWGFIAFLASLSSCRTPSQSTVKYIGGELARKDQFPSTVFLLDLCTAAKIGDRLYLTAGHCISERGLVAGYPLSIGYGVEFYSPNETKVSKVYLTKVKQVFVHPSYYDALKTYNARREILAKAVPAKTGDEIEIEAMKEFLMKGSDVAVIEVEDSNPVAIASVSSETVQQGDEVLVGGYGCRAENTDNESYLYFARKKIQAVHERRFVIPVEDANGITRSAICRGDSGGPAYKQGEDGNLTIVGVNSSVDAAEALSGAQMASGILTRVDNETESPGIADWIKSVPPPVPVCLNSSKRRSFSIDKTNNVLGTLTMASVSPVPMLCQWSGDTWLCSERGKSADSSDDAYQVRVSNMSIGLFAEVSKGGELLAKLPCH